MLGLNPWFILGIVLASIAIGGGCYVKGRSDGKAIVISSQQKDDQIRFETMQIAQHAAAEEIAKIQVVNKTVYARTTHEVVHDVQYRECVHSPDGLQLVNAALTNAPIPTGISKLPGVDPAR